MSSSSHSSSDRQNQSCHFLPTNRSEDDDRVRDLLQVATILNNHHASAPPDASLQVREVPTTSTSTPFQFRNQTIAPSPPPPAASTDTCRSHHQSSHQATSASPLRILTDIAPSTTPARNRAIAADRPSLQHKTSASSLRPISRTPSVRATFSRALGTASGASSTVSSPIITAMGDMTPLPSPLLANDSPGPWKRLGSPSSLDAIAAFASTSPTTDAVRITAAGGESTTAAAAMPHQKQRKAYGSLSHDGPAGESHEDGVGVVAASGPAHTRNRSVSEYIPNPMHVPKRMVTVSGSHPKLDKMESPYEPQLRREPHLSEARGLTPVEKPPTPPPSESSVSGANDTASSLNGGPAAVPKIPRHEYFEAYGRNDNKLRRWRAIKPLGQGTFSRVVLATSSSPASDSAPDSSQDSRGEDPSRYDRRTLVAVKICEHGPAGGASEDRVEMSLKRELQIMQCIHHPSLVHLRAWNIEPTRAILVLSYCPGGDLFDVATKHRALLTPPLLRRIFAELVAAVTYLHDRRIVHRDIKLENVLVNLPAAELASSSSTSSSHWTQYPYPVITLADLGLSRRVAASERLETRCGSDDYAAPEVIMGQAYDGRATDAWSLGVLLYALLESRLPFDPAPGVVGLDAAMQMRMRSRTSHRIARVEWRWIEFGVGEGAAGDGDHEADAAKFERRGLQGAREVVEGLLKRARSRWSLERVRELDWVRGGIDVPGGIRFREEDEGEEVVAAAAAGV